MKGKLRKRIGAGILTAALIATSFGVDFVTVSAGDTYPYVGAGAKEENQPYQHGYRVEDIMGSFCVHGFLYRIGMRLLPQHRRTRNLASLLSTSR